jgi:plasmid stability protein
MCGATEPLRVSSTSRCWSREMAAFALSGRAAPSSRGSSRYGSAAREIRLDRAARSLAPSPSIASNGQGAIIDSIMAQRLVRNVDDELVQALHVQATSHGRSAEAEHREIVRAALLGDRPDFKAFLENMPDGDSDDDRDLERDRALRRNVDL